MPIPILNRHHLEKWPEGCVYVGRGTVLGNPFAIGPDGTRDEVIERYTDWLNRQIDAADPVIITALIGAARSKGLVCSCAPSRCHAESINEGIERIRAQGLPQFPRTRSYSGIGSRRTPPGMLRRMTEIARRLAARGYTLRSGGADGADSAFETGAGSQVEIFLPWPGFGGRESPFAYPTQDAMRLASCVHPVWKSLKEEFRPLMARNSHQVLGNDLCSPVDFVLCYTPDGTETEAQRTRATGGTGQAIAIADRWSIPVFNLRNEDALERVKAFLDGADVA